MQPAPQNSRFTPFVQQNDNNTTAWVGNAPGNNREVCQGQSFTAPSNGELATIEIFSNLVSSPGEVVMSLHQLDDDNEHWGPGIGSSAVSVSQEDAGHWITFQIPSVHLTAGQTYGFKIKSSKLIGLGEAVGSYANPPFKGGHEWKFSGSENDGKSYDYFSLAFKVGLRA
ncbi:MAG: hypothetical protein ABIT96_02380 [Ferruginibacter sp.]